MPIRARENLLGAWAFLCGIVIAVVVGLYTGERTNPLILGVLAVLGLIVGFSVSQKNVQTFLFASVSLVIVSFAGMQGMVLSAAVMGINIGKIVASILGTLIVLFVPAAIIVSLKTVFSLAKS